MTTTGERCRQTCPHGDQCTLENGHDGGCNHRVCDCNDASGELVYDATPSGAEPARPPSVGGDRPTFIYLGDGRKVRVVRDGMAAWLEVAPVDYLSAATPSGAERLEARALLYSGPGDDGIDMMVGFARAEIARVLDELRGGVEGLTDPTADADRPQTWVVKLDDVLRLIDRITHGANR